MRRRARPARPSNLLGGLVDFFGLFDDCVSFVSKRSGRPKKYGKQREVKMKKSKREDAECGMGAPKKNERRSRKRE